VDSTTEPWSVHLLSHTLFLNDKNLLYGFGMNTFGQLGTGNTNNIAIPIQIKLGLNSSMWEIIDMEAGLYASILIVRSKHATLMQQNMHTQCNELCNLTVAFSW